jgi:hypothetical protein
LSSPARVIKALFLVASAALSCSVLAAEVPASWRVHGPFAVVARDPQESRRLAEADQDGNAAYQKALLWYLPGNAAQAKKSAAVTGPGCWHSSNNPSSLLTCRVEK